MTQEEYLAQCYNQIKIMRKDTKKNSLIIFIIGIVLLVGEIYGHIKLANAYENSKVAQTQSAVQENEHEYNSTLEVNGDTQEAKGETKISSDTLLALLAIYDLSILFSIIVWGAIFLVNLGAGEFAEYSFADMMGIIHPDVCKEISIE